MVAVSIVIITRDQSEILVECLDKAKIITDDIVIIDNGNTNNQENIYAEGCRVFKKNWDGYGANKNKGVLVAKYDWILSIDADEVPDDELIKALHNLNYTNPAAVYDIKFRTYFGDKMIRFGSWGKDHHIRLFNRNTVRWLDTTVHETLVIPPNVQVEKIDGYLHHYSVKDAVEYDVKNSLYAKLSAVKYFNSGKKAGFVKLYISPVFGFLKNYILHLGFLDGREGWQIAKITLKNTQRKYRLLSQMQGIKPQKQVYKDSFAIEY
ncbi:glycosyltransferase family 2 protein [Mucilaginibacter sp. L196]|uniref:glycosyltransferase family 2 protein n=1 Tax=Mucilaginibacter sp. L196 TaxID=1641870 RepID=UPI00131EB04B|nr:glycosyltransferase family 2 protein [Mucilaginibacter sp. L196]